MSLEKIKYKNLENLHEIQVGNFSVIGRFPVIVIAQIRDIFEKSGRPLFVTPGPSVRVILDEIDGEFQEDLTFPIKTLILDPNLESHLNLADRFQQNIRWFSDRSFPHVSYRGTFFDDSEREFVYTGGGEVERFRAGSLEGARLLAGVICSVRESGVSAEEVRQSFDQNSSSILTLGDRDIQTAR